MKSIKIFTLLFIVIILTSVTSCLQGSRNMSYSTSQSKPSSNYFDEIYQSMPTGEKLIEHSDFVVFGEVIGIEILKMKVTYEPSVNIEDLYTVSKFKITTSYKGKLKTGDVIKVAQRGDNDTRISRAISENGGYFKKNDKLILFLFQDSNDRPYFTINQNQSQFWINSDNLVFYGKNPNDNLFLNIKTLNDFEKIFITK